MFLLTSGRLGTFRFCSAYNEAIALDYVIPFRVLTPESTGDSDTDPVHRINLAGFVGRVNGMLNARKRDPALERVAVLDRLQSPGW